MKFIGKVKGELKILSEVDESQLQKLLTDFCWIDIDRIDPVTELAMKNLFGIISLNESGHPTITPHDKYDLVLLNYYYQQTKRELQVMLTSKCIITAHSGSDPACDEVTASLDQMLMSGALNIDGVLYGLFEAIVRLSVDRLRGAQEAIRTLELQMKSGITSIQHLSQLNRDFRELRRVFYETEGQMADIISKTIPLRGVGDTAQFTFPYSRMKSLSKIANDLLEILDDYSSDLLPEMWAQISRTKRTALGLSILSLFVGASALFMTMFKSGFPGVPIAPEFIALGLLAIGMIGLAAAQTKPKFRVS